MSTIVLGNVCDNTCLGYTPGDNTPDFLGLFGQPFAQLSGTFTLNLGTLTDSLTINNHTFTWAVTNPHFSIVTSSPLLASFAPGAFEFVATGTSAYGIGVAETEFLCPIPGVPEPATCLIMLVGFAGIFAAFKKRGIA